MKFTYAELVRDVRKQQKAMLDNVMNTYKGERDVDGDTIFDHTGVSDQMIDAAVVFAAGCGVSAKIPEHAIICGVMDATITAAIRSVERMFEVKIDRDNLAAMIKSGEVWPPSKRDAGHEGVKH